MRTTPCVLCSTAVGFVAAGCFSMGNFMTARTTEPGHPEVSVGAIMLPEADGALPLVNLRAGLNDRWDIGLRVECLSYSLDTRIMVATEEENRFDVSLEGGMGLSLFPIPFTYVGISLGKTYESNTPYIHFRYVHTNVKKKDEEEDNPLASSLLDFLTAGMFDMLQVFVGVEVKVNDRFSIIPEVLWVPEMRKDGQQWLSVGAVFNFTL